MGCGNSLLGVVWGGARNGVGGRGDSDGTIGDLICEIGVGYCVQWGWGRWLSFFAWFCGWVYGSNGGEGDL